MSDLDMDAADHPLDLSRLPSNFINMMLQSMSLSHRFSCALVCKTWAHEAAAATRSIILRDRIQDLSCLQRWLEKHGDQFEVLQLRKCDKPAKLTLLPCPQLQELLLNTDPSYDRLSVDSRVWSDIAAATKLTSVSLGMVQTASEQADVVSALTALPDLEQLTWNRVWSSIRSRKQWGLTDSKLLHKLTKLTALKLSTVYAAAAFEHVGLLTRLQDLSLGITKEWAAAGCPGLQELKALTRLELVDSFSDIPASVSQLTALRQLDVVRATPTALNKLSALTGLTWLRVRYLKGMLLDCPPLHLPGLQHFEVFEGWQGRMPKSFLGSSTQLQVLKLWCIDFSGPGRLAANSMLQHLLLYHCRVSAADEAAGPWQQVFPGPGRLPHLTSLQLTCNPLEPDLQHANMEGVVSCCSSLQVLCLHTLPASAASALTRLSSLTSLMLYRANDKQCSSLAQLTGLRELRVDDASEVFAAGLRQLAALEQLTSLGSHDLGWSSDALREHMSGKLPGPRSYYVYHTSYLKYALINKAPAGQPPDVSARLRRACDMAAAADQLRRLWQC